MIPPSSEVERGQTLILFALVFGLALAVFAVFVFDVQALFAARLQAEGAAMVAAQAAATAIDPYQLERDRLALDPTEAEARCARVSSGLSLPRRSVITCSVAGAIATATITMPVRLPVPWGAAPRVRASRRAQAAVGVDRAR